MTLSSAAGAPTPLSASSARFALQGKPRLALPMLLFLLALTVPVLIPLGPIVLTASRIIIILAIVPALVGLFSGRFGRILPTDWLFMLHGVWALAALMANNPDRTVQFGGVYNIDFFGAYMMGRAYVRSRSDMVALIQTMAFVVALTLPFAIFESLTGRSLITEIIRSIPGIGANPKTFAEKRMGLTRVQVALPTPIHYGIYATTALGLCFFGLKGVIPSARRVLLSASIFICGFLSLSSGAVLAIIAQGFLFGWQAMVRSPKRWLLLLGLTAFAYLVIDIASSRSPMRVFMSYATFSAQSAYWRDLIFTFGMENVWAHPLFGIGLNDWARPAWMYISSVDNFWLLTTMRFGIPGFLFLFAGYVMSVAGAIRAPLDGDPVTAQIRRAWVITMVVLTLSLYTVHVWAEIHSAVFLMVGAGMWLTDARPEARDVRPAPEPKGPVWRRNLPGQQRYAKAPSRQPDRAGIAYSRFSAKRRS
ncbi:MAG TPA: O-antigen ligase family protein [Paenirhodobacter sp.]